MNYLENQKKELLFANRILNFDCRFWDRREETLTKSVNDVEQAIYNIQIENHEYLRGIKSSTKEQNLRVAGSLLRSLLESTANGFWIAEDKSGKRARKYISSTKNFDKYTDTANVKGQLTELRIPKEVISWTTSSAEDRINAFSPQAGLIWDYCSIFTHASPSYLSLQPGIDKVLDFVIVQANIYAVTLRCILDNSTEIYTSKESLFLHKMAIQALINKSPR